MRVLIRNFLTDSIGLSKVTTSNHVHHSLISGRGLGQGYITADTLSKLQDQFGGETHFSKASFLHNLLWLLGFFIDNKADSIFSNLGLDSRCDFEVFTREESNDLHDVVGESTSLVRADVVSSSHDLTRGKLLHITLVVQHLDDGVSESNHDGQR